MKKVLTVLGLAVALAIPQTAALAAEEGAVFDGGTCVEADGTPGVSTAWGDCMTAADYDEVFSFENLSETASFVDPSQSVAEVYELVDDGVPASERPLGAGLVDDSFKFKEVIGLQQASDGEWFYVGNGFIIS